MKKITIGFKLLQPWANETVKGNLNYLVRSFNTKKRERVAVIASHGFDRKWLLNVRYDYYKEYVTKIGAIGSVEIKDSVEVDIANVEKTLVKLTSKKYVNNYPKHLIPRFTRNKKAYIWILENPKEWIKPKNVKGGGMTWAKVNFHDK